MPCPLPSSPPGIFDLLVPHSLLVSFLGGALLPGVLLGAFLWWIIRFARRLHQIAPGREKDTLLRMTTFGAGWVVFSILIICLAWLWTAALDAWLFQPSCPNAAPIFSTAFNQSHEEAQQVFFGALALYVIGAFFLGRCQRRIERLPALVQRAIVNS